jgi:hypothetical protein
MPVLSTTMMAPTRNLAFKSQQGLIQETFFMKYSSVKTTKQNTAFNSCICFMTNLLSSIFPQIYASSKKGQLPPV